MQKLKTCPVNDTARTVGKQHHLALNSLTPLHPPNTSTNIPINYTVIFHLRHKSIPTHTNITAIARLNGSKIFFAQRGCHQFFLSD